MVKEMSVGALAYDSVPLSSAAKLDYFLSRISVARHRQGRDDSAHAALGGGRKKYSRPCAISPRNMPANPPPPTTSANSPKKIYGAQTHLVLFPVDRLHRRPRIQSQVHDIPASGNNKGFRIVGEITQDLDLFRMPIDLRIDTDGKTENKRIEVVGTDSPFSVETFGRPRRISIDPENRVLTNSRDIKLRSSIVRGQGLMQQGDLAGALSEFNKALEVNKNSSLAHYRIAEVFFLQHNYQSSANAYRASLNGDGDPRWTEVWSHLQLGKIFDITGQRERAVNEYRQAMQTNDNT